MAPKKNAGRKREKKQKARKKRQEKQAEYVAASLDQRFEAFNQGGSEISTEGAPDRRILERVMAQAMGLDSGLSDDESEANELFFEALEIADPESRLELLKEALEMNPRHIDALVEITQFCDQETGFDILEQALEFGEEDLQAELRDNVGHFWGLHHTRPFMRAKQALVERLVGVGLWHDAADEIEEMLRLNPNDNQGMRWLLMEGYCHLDRLDDAEDLMNAYPEEGFPFLPFTGLLIRFKKEGDSPELRAALCKQAERNPHIVPRLLEPSLIDREEHALFSPFSPEEADLYCQQFLSSWKSTPGAITWLRSASRDLPLADVDAFDDEAFNRDVKAEVQKLRTKAKKLKSCGETWFCEASHVSEDVSEGWMLSIIEEETDEAIWMEPGDGSLGADSVLHGLLNSMLTPDIGAPRRPAVVNFIDAQLCQSLNNRLQQLGIAANLVDEKPALLNFIDQTMHGEEEAVEIDLDAMQDTPASMATWEIDWRQLETWIPNEDGQPIQPWTIFVAHENGLMLSQDVSFETPDSQKILGVIADAVLGPAVGSPERPAAILTSSTEHLLDLKSAADAIGADCAVGECPILNEMFESLSEQMGGVGGGPKALITIPDITPEIVGDLFEAAAAFYKKHVWSFTPPETVVKVRCSDLIHGSWYAVIMGQMGEELGVMLFDDPDALETLLGLGPDDTQTGVTEMRGIAFSLNEQQMVHPRDVAAAEQFGWPVAAPEAWPMAYFVSDGDLRLLEVAELQFLSAAMPAVVAQLQTRKSSLETSVALQGRTVLVATSRK